MQDDLSVAVIIPCYNEEHAIATVISSFKQQLPNATIYVYDNNSIDKTVRNAQDSGAIVRREPQQGKGHVVRRMFSDVEASVYVMVDGDGTYDASTAPVMIRELLDNHLDMVNAKRISKGGKTYRSGHETGNKLFTELVGWLFGKRSEDVFSGYRVFSRRFVKSFPALSTGFEIETELTIHSSTLNLPISEVESSYHDRFEGSESKLNTYGDGIRIFAKIFMLLKEERPVLFFTSIAFILTVVSLGVGGPVVLEFVQTSIVSRTPSALAAASIMVLAFLSFAVGLLLDSITRGRREVRRLNYLNCPWLLPKDESLIDRR